MRRFLILTSLFASALFCSNAVVAQQTSDPRIADFVKTGKLRAAFGMNPTLAVKDPTSGNLRGPALELARALATRMKVELVTVEYPSPGAVLGGLDTKSWDVTFLVIDPGRASVVDFSPPYMQSDFTYLVPGDSKIAKTGDVEQAGVRVAVVRNDASDLRVSRMLKQAEIVRADNLNAAVELVRAGQASALAAPRPVLSVQSTKFAGSRVLDDGFATISYALVIPKGNAGFLAYLGEFVQEAKSSGLVKRTIESSGLKGLQIPAGQ